MSDSPHSSSSGRKDKKNKKDGDKKPQIVKAVRACNNCRATRTRCIGCDDPPCKRCTNANLECVFERPPKEPGIEAEERIRGLESQMGGVQSALSEILHTLRGNLGPPVFPRQPQPTWNGSPSHFSPPNQPTPGPLTFTTTGGTYALGDPPFPSPSAASSSSQPSTSAYRVQPPHQTSQAYPPPPPPQSKAAPSPSRLPASSLPSRPPPPTVTDPIPARAPSPARSDDASSEAGEELPPSGLVAPLSSIHRLAEAASVREHEPSSSKRPGEEPASAADGGPPSKRVKFGEVSHKSPVRQQADDVPSESGLSRGQVHTFTSSLEASIVTDEEARRLHDIYWSGADQYLSVFDPSTDTYENMKKDRPFCFSAICYVGASIEDNGGPISDLQRRLWEHLKQQAMETLFSRTVRVGAVQALLLTSGWNDAGWLCGGHAVRLGTDLGCHEAFSRLLSTGMGANKTAHELEAERDLVARARTGFVLFNFDCQSHFGNGRAPIVQVDEAILRCQELLNHPLSVETDLKTVSTTELMAIRAKYHKELAKTKEEATIDAATIDVIGQANEEVNAWYRKWVEISNLRSASSPERKRLREQSLLAQREYTSLFHNCFSLRGINNADDVLRMPPSQRTLALRALRNAQMALGVCLSSDSYRTYFVFSVHYTKVTAAWVGSLLLRLARLFPKELDLRKTAKDVDELAGLLAQAGAGRYARSLRLMLRKARRRRVVPPASAPSSRPGSPPRPASLAQLHPTAPPSNHLQPSHPAAQAYLHPPPLPTTTQSPAAQHDGPPADFSFDLRHGGSSGPGLDMNLTESSPSGSLLSFDWDWDWTSADLSAVSLPAAQPGALPLWLDSDLGSVGQQLLSGGMEDFFLPSEVDLQLGGWGGTPEGGTGGENGNGS